MVVSPMVMAGGGAALVALLALGIAIRVRHRRAAEREHEAYLDDLVRGPVVAAPPNAIEAILIRDDQLFREPPPALPRRAETQAPVPVAPVASAPSMPLENEPARDATPPAPPVEMPMCKADQLAVHVAELAAQTAALTDAVIDLVARGAVATLAPAPEPEPEPAPQPVLTAVPEPEPEPMPAPVVSMPPLPEPEPMPAPLEFRPLGAPLADDYEELPRRARADVRRAPEPEPEPEFEREPVRAPAAEPYLESVFEEADARVHELVREPPRPRSYDDAFDWPSENELRAFSGRNYGRADRV